MEQPTVIKNYHKRALDIILDEEEDIDEDKNDSFCQIYGRKQDTLRAEESVHSSFELVKKHSDSPKMVGERAANNQNLN
jgi:hypothetical protein